MHVTIAEFIYHGGEALYTDRGAINANKWQGGLAIATKSIYARVEEAP